MANFPRLINTLARTSKFVLQRPQAANPVYRVLAQDKHLYRGFATVFERTKPHVNVGEYFTADTIPMWLILTMCAHFLGTIGHVDHGKVRCNAAVGTDNF